MTADDRPMEDLLAALQESVDRARGIRPAAAPTDGQADEPPVYLALDVWQALGLPDAEFVGYYERTGWAETWAVLMAAVRGPGRCGKDADGEPCALAPHSESTPCYGASDVGSSEPLPWPAAPADDTAAPDTVTVPRVHLQWWAEFLRELVRQDAIRTLNARDAVLDNARSIAEWAAARPARDTGDES